MNIETKIVVNPEVVLREEFDDWAVLFNPENGEGYGINPVSVAIWKELDGKKSVKDAIDAVIAQCDDVPAEAVDESLVFIESLLERGLAGEVV